MFKTKTTVTYCVGFYSFRSFQKIKDISSFAKVVLFSIGSSIGSIGSIGSVLVEIFSRSWFTVTGPVILENKK